MIGEELKTYLQRELPEILRQDQSFRAWLEQLIRETALTSAQFDLRFEQLLRELAEDRAEQKRKWEEQDRKWDGQNQTNQRLLEEIRQSRARWDEQDRKWDEQNRKWEEQNRKWDEQNQANQKLLEEIRQSRSRQEQGISAIGARWGLASEHSFREALKGILEQSFGVEVLNINEFDDEGVVFGRPDQVELDILIKNGLVILCELKSSMSKGDMYLFDRKVQYYTQRHQRPVQRKLVISSMVHPSALPVAQRLGIEVFSYADEDCGLRI
ncbi:PD-(D/E)XK nuclease family protein [Thiorhodospira sibirica]|uniref:PD-(D/E)XK nuclease family protein n=1 Tax=Thiorhodospira sibirica TaxID=154347 RepID=UPI00022C58D9|nr:DUF3782 domain-containing protein [Thiorhodospira sibirica]